MSIIIMVLIGVGLTISNSNGWFVVPNYCIWICFGIAALLAVIAIIQHIAMKHEISKTRDRFRF